MSDGQKKPQPCPMCVPTLHLRVWSCGRRKSCDPLTQVSSGPIIPHVHPGPTYKSIARSRCQLLSSTTNNPQPKYHTTHQHNSQEPTTYKRAVEPILPSLIHRRYIPNRPGHSTVGFGL